MRAGPTRAPQDALELALIRSLAGAFMPTTIMSVGFTIAGALIVWRERDPALLMLLIGGVAACAARMAVAFRLRNECHLPDLAVEQARRLEWDFRVGHSAFAAMLGLFSFRAFMLDAPSTHMLMLCLVMGYAAGVAATVALRPRIAIPSMMMALIPTILIALAGLDPIYMSMALMTAGFLFGGIYNLRIRHARAVGEIALRISFGTIARKDSLTALPNRIALREWFDERGMDPAASGLIAVHYLDLDGFKPVNDRFGHPCGDVLLAAVGKRIAGVIRGTDIAARLGGDEFAVVQFGIESEDHAEHLARRLSAAIARPYHIDGRALQISTSIGYVVTARYDDDLEHLLTLADQALYASKRQGTGITRHAPESAALVLDAA